MARVLLISLALVASPALAQSINLLFGPADASVPDSTYGAVGPSGYWNLISGPGSTPLRGLNGSLTSIPNPARSDFSATAIHPIGPTGNDALLLAATYNFASLEDQFVIHGLQDGPYRAIFYGINGPFGVVAFGGEGSTGDGEAVLSGPWRGSLTPGIYTSFPLTVTNGTMDITVSLGFEGGIWSAMQIVQVPSPAALSLLATGAVSLTTVRRRR